MASRSDSFEAQSFPKERMELTCPVCLEEFDDPKILPHCKHNVCRHCIQNMMKRKSKSLCPVCRCEFILGADGIDNLATNLELLEMVTSTREEREKQEVATMFERCVQKMADANKLLEDHQLFSQRRQEYADQLKEQIHNVAENIISCARKKERELCDQVQREMVRHENESEKQRNKIEKLVEESSAVISKLEDVLNNEDEITSENRKDIIIESKRIINAKMYENLSPFDVVTANFSPNMSILSKMEKEGFGKVYSTNANYYTNIQSSQVNGTTHSRTESKPLEPFTTIRADDLGLEYFAPLSLASDGKKHIAVADPANSHVLLLDSTGRLMETFKPPGKNSEPLTFSGVAFTKKDGELIAVCGSTEVFYLNIKDGGFKMTYRTNEKYGVRYCFVTVGSDGRVLLTCEPSMRHFRSCIFMYKDIPFGKPDLMFGLNGYDHRLEFPFKAIYHNNEYYVSDMEKGCILVYNSQGVYRRQFGSKDEDGTSSSQLVLPTGMALCPDKKCFYVCDWGSSSVQVYKPDGTFVAMFTIEGRPTDIVVLDNGTVVVSSKDDQWVKFYTFPSFSVM